MSNVQDFGAFGDGKHDDWEAIQHAIDAGDGIVEFPRGNFRITKPLVVDLEKRSRTSLHGNGGIAKILMDGEGPAIVLKATHAKTADPDGFRPEEWQRERMPTIDGLEIEGTHEKADGIQIIGVMQPTLTRVLIRKVHTAVHVTERARNLLISHCHFYHNTGVGVHLDKVNLHQSIITGSHISYCRLGGIRIEDSEIRNLQITGNDIEYNNNRAFKIPDADGEPTAEIFIKTGEEGSVREGTIASNTIQATNSPNGANIRFIGDDKKGDHRVGMWTITGNLIGSQRVGIHLSWARGVTINGNYIYSGHHRNLLVDHSRNVVIGPNCFGHNPDYRKKELATGITFEDSQNCNITGVLIEDAEAGEHTVSGTVPIVRKGLIELIRCRRMNVTGTQVLDGTPNGLYLEDCSETSINGCTILDDREPKLMETAIQWKGKGDGNMISSSRIGKGSKSALTVPDGVRLSDNLLDS
ncbi:MAG: hypothetical protein CMJ78_18635 [Planctomycetaceae bacterium]|nr:hypothetical protein [Planctomycetaceae bacterium]